jgi:hypothetical protein
MGRLRLICLHFWSFKGGSPCLYRLRIDHLTLVNKIELCTSVYNIYGDPANVVASTIAELDDIHYTSRMTLG